MRGDQGPGIKLPAAGVIEQVNGGLYDHVSVYRCIGSFGISDFHQPRWCWRSKASPLINCASPSRSEEPVLT
jgi:hypothetical protein